MSYRFKEKDDDVEKAVRRVARSQIDAAIGEIDSDKIDRAETVHQVRKRFKKLRALARLVRPAFPAYAEENATFRDAARSLSGVRDAQANLETFDALAERFGTAFDAERFAPVRERLVERRRAVHDRDDLVDAQLKIVRETLAEARERAKRWSLDARGPAAFRDGVKKTLKRGRKAFASAVDEPSTARLHELRKRAKYHWYHVRLLREVWPGLMEARADELDRLGDLLGDDHDLAVLGDELERMTGAGLDPEVARDLGALAGRRRAELQAAGLALAGRAFAGSPGKEADRLVELWRAWRARPDVEDPGEAAAPPGPAEAASEIERKFVVTGDGWRDAVASSRHIRQGYLVNDRRLSLRVRITDDERAEMTAKSPDPTLARTEIEFPVPLEDARKLMALAKANVIEKRRHVVPVGGVEVEVDEFEAPEKGLVIAEVELSEEGACVPEADWLGPEVTGDARFYGAVLAGAAQ